MHMTSLERSKSSPALLLVALQLEMHNARRRKKAATRRGPAARRRGGVTSPTAAEGVEEEGEEQGGLPADEEMVAADAVHVR